MTKIKKSQKSKTIDGVTNKPTKKVSKLIKKPQTLDELDAQTLPPKPTPRTLDSLFGDTGVSKFGTLDTEEFKEKLDKLSESKLDLEQYAANHGLRSDGNIERLKNKLVNMFITHANQYKNLKVVDTLPKKVNTEILRKLMADGR